MKIANDFEDDESSEVNTDFAISKRDLEAMNKNTLVFKSRKKLGKAWKYFKKKFLFFFCFFVLLLIVLTFDLGTGEVDKNGYQYTDPSKFIPLPEDFTLLD